MMMMAMMMMVQMVQVEMIKTNFTKSRLLDLRLLLKLGRVLNHVVLNRRLKLRRLLNSELLVMLGLGFRRTQRGKLGYRLGLKLEQIVVVVGMGVVLKLLEGQGIDGGGASIGKERGLLLLQRRRSTKVGAQGIPVERRGSRELRLMSTRRTHDYTGRVVNADGYGDGTVGIIWR